jgi:GNAT superfamily N-acetyltransferase
MSSAFAIAENDEQPFALAQNRASAGFLKVSALSNKDEDEVLVFLSHRPRHTVFMSGLIRDNGLVTFSNRGTFFGCRDQQDRLQGVALIGQKTLVESRSSSALETLGPLLPRNHAAHLLRGEESQIESLLGYYAAAGRRPRLLRDERLLELDAPLAGVRPEPCLRLANSDDLAVVAAINAGLAVEETGHNPMTNDPRGMLERTERRIARGRVWILMEDGKTIFKADVISDTPQVAFVEGVFVRWQERRKGHGLRCITQLARNLLSQNKTICLVVNEENSRALAFYDKAGFKCTSSYNTAYFSTL